jgi:hypothetical protein
VKTTHRSGSDCNWLNSFEYTVTDACGNAYPAFKITYTGNDQTAPEVIDVCPTAEDFGYSSSMGLTALPTGDEAEQAFASIRDQFYTDCGGAAGLAGWNISNPVMAGDACSGTATYTIDLYDQCGNVNSSCSFVINYFDDVAPVYSCPPTIDLGFNPPMSTIWSPPVIAQAANDVTFVAIDACDGELAGTRQGSAGYNISGPFETINGTVRRYTNYMRPNPIYDANGNAAVGYCETVFTFTLPYNPADGNGDELSEGEAIEGAPSGAAPSGDEDVSLDFQAYPVPFNQDVTVKYNFKFDTEVTVEVYDTKGLLVLSKKAAYKAGGDATMPLRINGSDQMYYVKLITNKGTVTKKILASKL